MIPCHLIKFYKVLDEPRSINQSRERKPTMTDFTLTVGSLIVTVSQGKVKSNWQDEPAIRTLKTVHRNKRSPNVSYLAMSKERCEVLLRERAHTPKQLSRKLGISVGAAYHNIYELRRAGHRIVTKGGKYHYG